MTAVQDRYKIADDLRDDYAIGESKACIYVLLSSWAEEGLGHGRCGAVVEAVAFTKRGEVLFGRCAVKYAHGVDKDGWLLASEARVLRKLRDILDNHPRIIQYLDWITNITVDDVPQRKALVVEYIDGWTLAEICSRWPSALWPVLDVQMIKWLTQLAEGLMALHENYVTHGDIKMHNLMVKNDGSNLVIIDFGFASIHKPEVFDPSRDMAQVGKVIAQMIAHRSPAARKAYQMDSSLQSCKSIVDRFGKKFLGFEPQLGRLFTGEMSAEAFHKTMLQCKLLALERSRKLRELDGKKGTLIEYLRRSSQSSTLKSKAQGSRL